MSTLRKILFWTHLSAGVTAGIVILIMSATGAALAYERQLNEWTLRHLRSTPPLSDARPLAVEELLAVVRRDHPDTEVTAVTLSSRPDAPVAVQAESGPLYVDAYTGQKLGERGGAGLRAFLSQMRGWHRYLAMEGDNRSVARAITGWSNGLFLFIVVSGIFIWMPRVWTWVHVRGVLIFRRQYGTSKARDFNWHHVIGIWSAIPLFIVVLGAVPISFPWASDFVYRVVGEEPPPRGRPAGPPGGESAGPRAAGPRGQGGPAARTPERAERAGRTRGAVSTAGLNLLVERAQADQAGWRTINIRLPRSSDAPVVFSIDRGDGGQPQLRSTLSLDSSGQVVARETFGDQTLGRRIRSILRFAHTGEVLGLAGQTIAGLASAGAVVMVYTGLALTWRRSLAWVSRRRRVTASAPPGTAPSTVVPAMSSRPSQESV
jgi:uncharacterized iron-regulated membrane protein